MFGSPDSTAMWLNLWATREFVSAVAADVADIMNLYGQYAGRRKYEQVDLSVYSLINYNEVGRVLSEWQRLTMRTQNIYELLPTASQSAFFELVLHLWFGRLRFPSSSYEWSEVSARATTKDQCKQTCSR